MTTVQGRCPACRGNSLFIGSGGYITCSRIDCPDPSAADELLHGDRVGSDTPLVCSDERHAAKVADLERQLAALRAVARGYCPACGRGDAAPTVEDWENERQNAAFWLDQHKRARQSAADQRQRAKRAETALREILATLYPITRTSDPTPLGYQAIHPIHPDDVARWRAVLPERACTCGEPTGADEDDIEARNRWIHSRSCAAVKEQPRA
jgi:hypothetical protein